MAKVSEPVTGSDAQTGDKDRDKNISSIQLAMLLKLEICGIYLFMIKSVSYAFWRSKEN
jgi:hypothetical protein